MSEPNRDQPSLPGIGARRMVANDMSAIEIDAKIATSRAESDTKFAQLRGDFHAEFATLRGEIKATNAKLDTVISYTSGTKATIVVTGIASAFAMAGLILAALAFAGDRFGAGMDVSAIADAAVERAAFRSFEDFKPPSAPETLPAVR